MRDPSDVNAEPSRGSAPNTTGFAPQETVEEFQINANTVLERLQTLLRQGNIRKIVIKTEEGRPLVTLPLTVGVAGGTLSVFLGPLFTVGVMALILLAARLTIAIEKTVD